NVLVRRWLRRRSRSRFRAGLDEGQPRRCRLGGQRCRAACPAKTLIPSGRRNGPGSARGQVDSLARMESWVGPLVPNLPRPGPPPGAGPALSLYDTARREVFRTGEDSGPSRRRTMYVCGITPYDATHLGHAATMITFDLVNRLWRDQGYEVSYVQNVTDI